MWRRWAWAGLVVAGSCVSVSAIGARAQIHVEFLADGRCTVSATGEGFHSILTYLPQTELSPTSGLRCAIPPVPEGLQVDLTGDASARGCALARRFATSQLDRERLPLDWHGVASGRARRRPHSGIWKPVGLPRPAASVDRRRSGRRDGGRVDRSRPAKASEIHGTVMAPVGSLKALRSTLPTIVFGNSMRNSMREGTL